MKLGLPVTLNFMPWPRCHLFESNSALRSGPLGSSIQTDPLLLQRERFGFFNLPIENSLHRPPKAYFQLSTEGSTHSLTALHHKHPGLRAEERKGQTRKEGGGTISGEGVEGVDWAQCYWQ